jgi:hypothetical protein
MVIQQRPRERGGPITLEHPSARLGLALGGMMHASKEHVGDGVHFGYGIFVQARTAGRAPADVGEAYAELCRAVLAVGESLGLRSDGPISEVRAPAVARSKKADPSTPLRSRAGSTPAASTNPVRKRKRAS